MRKLPIKAKIKNPLVNKWVVTPLLSAIFVGSLTSPLCSYAATPLEEMRTSSFEHYNGLLNTDLTWKQLFSDRFVTTVNADTFMPAIDNSRQHGIVGDGLDLVKTDERVIGYEMSFFISEFSLTRRCYFRSGLSCLGRYVGQSAPDLDLYERCDVDPYTNLGRVQDSHGAAIKPIVEGLQAQYGEIEAHVQDILKQMVDLDQKQRRGRINNTEYLRQKDALKARLDSEQLTLRRASDVMKNVGPNVAKKLLDDVIAQGVRASSCQSINDLLSAGLLDEEFAKKNNINALVLEKMASSGYLFELSGQLALIANQEPSSPLIHQYRKKQIELYATYGLVMVPRSGVRNPPGFLNNVNLSAAHLTRTTFSLYEELLFLLDRYKSDYGSNETLSIDRDKTSITVDELIMKVREKLAGNETNISETNRIIRRNEGPNRGRH